MSRPEFRKQLEEVGGDYIRSRLEEPSNKELLDNLLGRNHA